MDIKERLRCQFLHAFNTRKTGWTVAEVIAHDALAEIERLERERDDLRQELESERSLPRGAIHDGH